MGVIPGGFDKTLKSMAGNALRIYFFCSMRISNSDLKLKFGGSTFLFAQGSGYNRFKRQSRKPQNPKHGTETLKKNPFLE